MISTKKPSESSSRQRNIGRTSLKADRLASLLETKTPQKRAHAWRLPHVQRKVAIGVCAVLVLVSAVSVGGMHLYTSKQIADQKALAIIQQAKERSNNIAADACRQKKAAEKANLIGKVTYDELYDFNECNNK